jgi:hypothetical protein
MRVGDKSWLTCRGDRSLSGGFVHQGEYDYCMLGGGGVFIPECGMYELRKVGKEFIPEGGCVQLHGGGRGVFIPGGEYVHVNGGCMGCSYLRVGLYEYMQKREGIHICGRVCTSTWTCDWDVHTRGLVTGYVREQGAEDVHI